MTATLKSSTELAAAFETEAQRLAEEFKVPGVSMALILPGGDHFLNFGVTSLDNPLPINADTIFQIGSNTKTLTSLTISALEEQGKLNVTDRVRDHLPNFKLQDESVAEQLTILDLLTHQGGFQGDLFLDTGPGDDALEKMIDAMADTPQIVPMRSHWSYSNAGFYVAGRVIEVASGMTYEAAVTEMVLKPLGMDHTFFFASEVITHRFATGYNTISGELVAQRPWLMMRSGAPAGSTCSSTTHDMAKYIHYVMSGTLSSDASEPPALATLDRPRLWKEVRKIGSSLNGSPGERDRIGQSWFLDQYDDALIISHGDSTLGHQSNIWLSPDRKVGFVSLTNAPNGHALNSKLSEWVKREVLGIRAPSKPDFEMSEVQLEVLISRYQVPGQPYTLDTKVESGQLLLVMPDPNAVGGVRNMALRFIGPDQAVIVGGDVDGTSVEFLRQSGELEFLRLGVRLYPLMSAIAPQEAL